MKYYTVADISKILSVKLLTVRRWIKDGKLTATMETRKLGYRIPDASFFNFLNEDQKYTRLAKEYAVLNDDHDTKLGAIEAEINQNLREANSFGADSIAQAEKTRTVIRSGDMDALDQHIAELEASIERMLKNEAEFNALVH